MNALIQATASGIIPLRNIEADHDLDSLRCLPDYQVKIAKQNKQKKKKKRLHR